MQQITEIIKETEKFVKKKFKEKELDYDDNFPIMVMMLNLSLEIGAGIDVISTFVHYRTKAVSRMKNCDCENCKENRKNFGGRY